ncbi:probable LRR receptor-like serine/threonine-protein kinase At1g53430 isoform X2 [Capsella rubella]|uniref:probable LRR receptor-like serine/threonine-protein kinase At1g53430 isoform X2 n=1 Tax=Capsella rubella TaxID=81985 RepID=UPI000CD4DD9F|nr:probable LRR receptor-like serine/threonine-protein kinase At1g53430 isoform X2 [Capsella rubella]
MMGFIFSIERVVYVLLLLLIFICFGNFGSNAQLLPEDEVQTLRTIFKELKNQTVNIERTSCTDGKWNFNGSTSPNPPTSNITCDCTFNANSTCHVTNIQLKSFSLAGIIPAGFGNLTKLQEIDLSRNFLNGTIPATLSQIPLEILSLTGNRLSGPFPPQLGEISTLADVNLETNLFTGSLPSNLGKLRSLKRLLLSSNNLTGQIPESFSNLKNLTEFRIDGNSVSGKIPDFIGNWTQLTRDIQGTSMEGPIPASISNLKSLTELRVTDLRGPPSSFPDLQNLTNMQRLVLRNCGIRGPIPAYIGTSMSKLKALDLSSNMLTGAIPDSFKNLEAFNFMYLNNNSLTGPVPPFIINSKENLDLSDNNFTQPPILSCSHLDVNLISSYPSVTDNSVQWCLKEDLPCPGDAEQSSLFINCGGSKVKIRKDTYTEDLNFRGQSTFSSVSEKWGYSSSGLWVGKEDAPYLAEDRFNMINESTPEYYKTARLSPQSLKYYGLCMRKGSYKLQLHFAEIMFSNDQTFNSLGRRIFDIYVQGNLLERDFNIAERAGGVGKPFTRQINEVQVNGSTLEIHLQWTGKGTTMIPTRPVYGPLISAITITPNFKVDTGKELSNGAVAGIVIAVCAVFGLLVLLILRLTGYLGGKEVDENEELRGLDLQTGSFTLKQIKRATNNFDPENKIGEGGFGPVYKGVLADGMTIAVKQLSSKSKQGNREFVTEIGMISALQHPNLVKLYGCCIEGKELLLVYEYLENNSLARALFGTEKQKLHLDWPTRNKICIGIAKGLAYLHEESRLKIVHRDIKATNVLLDLSLNAKISDFGLAKLDEDENTHISTRIAGTIGYMAPEYAMRGYLTDKADVYSFGVVCLEIVSGKSNTNYRPKEEFVYLLDWAYVLQEQGSLLELVDPDLGTSFSKKEAMRMLNIALLCTNPSPTLRPPMSSVVKMLEGKIKVQPPLVKREADPSGSAAMRFKAFELLSQDSESSQVSTYARNGQQHISSSSMDGPWVDSSFSEPSKDAVNQQQQEEARSSSSSRKLLDDLTDVKIE